MPHDTSMKEEKEMPHRLAILDKDLEVQNATIRSLREALSVVLNGQEPIPEEVAKGSPSLTELGGQLRSYSERLISNTQELAQMLSDLEL